MPIRNTYVYKSRAEKSFESNTVGKQEHHHPAHTVWLRVWKLGDKDIYKSEKKDLVNGQ